LTKKIIPPDIHTLHRIDYYLNIIEKAGLRCEDRYTEFFVSDADAAFIEDFLHKKMVKKQDLLIGINAGGNWYPKRWPKEYWAALADKLITELGAKVIITGGFPDLALTREIRNLMHQDPILSCGVFNLKQLGALFKKLDLFITADTGPLHIANAVGAKKIIAIFGPTSPQVTGPYPAANAVILQKDVGCKVPCYVVDCKDNRCMKAIGPDEVFEQARALLKK
jgi:ADP-heptose:LPS heptosyltransferase